MASPGRPRNAHVEFDVPTGKYVVVPHPHGKRKGYDTLQEALAAASKAEKIGIKAT